MVLKSVRRVQFLKIEKELRVMLTLNLFSIPSWAYLNYFSLN